MYGLILALRDIFFEGMWLRLNLEGLGGKNRGGGGGGGGEMCGDVTQFSVQV